MIVRHLEQLRAQGYNTIQEKGYLPGKDPDRAHKKRLALVESVIGTDAAKDILTDSRIQALFPAIPPEVRKQPCH
ncbi:hypothetical protein ACSPAH_02605 [Buttiauxella agrestis]